jgi:hypothetical protein
MDNQRAPEDHLQDRPSVRRADAVEVEMWPVFWWLGGLALIVGVAYLVDRVRRSGPHDRDYSQEAKDDKRLAQYGDNNPNDPPAYGGGI